MVVAHGRSTINDADVSCVSLKVKLESKAPGRSWSLWAACIARSVRHKIKIRLQHTRKF